jgi:hypothetical protein
MPPTLNPMRSLLMTRATNELHQPNAVALLHRQQAKNVIAIFNRSTSHLNNLIV